MITSVSHRALAAAYSATTRDLAFVHIGVIRGVLVFLWAMSAFGSRVPFSKFVPSPKIARSADAVILTTGSMTPEHIFAAQRMSVYAVRLFGLFCRLPNPAQNIGAVSNSVKMAGIYATTIATQMIQYQAFWNVSIVQVPGDTMGISRTRRFETPVATTVDVRSPLPAAISRIFVHLRPKSFFNSPVFSAHSEHIITYSVTS